MTVLNLARPVEGYHSMTIELERNGGWARYTFNCSAPEGSACREWCDVEDCEGYEDHNEHELRDHGRCLTKDWFDNDDEIQEGLLEDIEFTVPVDVTFETGDHYVWRVEQ